MPELRCQTVNTPRVICRELGFDDLPQVEALLTAGFAAQRRAPFWRRALGRLVDRPIPDGAPRFGFGLFVNERLVGVLLVLAATVQQRGEAVRRRNVSSFYVAEPFRPFGSLLVRRALREPGFVTINVTPAPATWALLEAQGYRRYAAGRAVAVPVAADRGRTGQVRRWSEASVPADMPPHETVLLREHAGWGCLACWCETEAGAVPFVFARRRWRGMPFAYLVHARSLEDVVTLARPLGRFLLRRGLPLLVVDGDHALPGMPSWFQPDRPKFVRGGPAPEGFDLAYTERAIFGV